MTIDQVRDTFTVLRASGEGLLSECEALRRDRARATPEQLDDPAWWVDRQERIDALEWRAVELWSAAGWLEGEAPGSA